MIVHLNNHSAITALSDVHTLLILTRHAEVVSPARSTLRVCRVSSSRRRPAMAELPPLPASADVVLGEPSLIRAGRCLPCHRCAGSSRPGPASSRCSIRRCAATTSLDQRPRRVRRIDVGVRLRLPHRPRAVDLRQARGAAGRTLGSDAARDAARQADRTARRRVDWRGAGANRQAFWDAGEGLHARAKTAPTWTSTFTATISRRSPPISTTW